MATLLLRFAAPLQAWGIDSKFETRNTERELSKSGVIGLLAAALGYKRTEPEKLEELNALRFGVRVDQEGKLLRDYHTARSDKSSYVTNRYYLSDAVFLVALEGEESLLKKLEYAVSHPAFPLYLGRRACPPTVPLCLGLRASGLLETLQKEAPLAKNPRDTARIIADARAEDANTAVVRDIPVSFDPRCRKHGYRTCTEYHLTMNTGESEHDPFTELEE